MSRIKNENLFLSSQESQDLLNILLMPKRDALMKRDSFLKDMNDLSVVSKEDGSVSFEIPELRLPKINQLIANLPQNVKKRELYRYADEICTSYKYDRTIWDEKDGDLEDAIYRAEVQFSEKYSEIRMSNIAA